MPITVIHRSGVLLSPARRGALLPVAQPQNRPDNSPTNVNASPNANNGQGNTVNASSNARNTDNDGNGNGNGNQGNGLALGQSRSDNARNLGALVGAGNSGNSANNAGGLGRGRSAAQSGGNTITNQSGPPANVATDPDIDAARAEAEATQRRIADRTIVEQLVDTAESRSTDASNNARDADRGYSRQAEAVSNDNRGQGNAYGRELGQANGRALRV